MQVQKVLTEIQAVINMATYTTEIRRLVENHFDLGLKDYPIFDEAYRATLNDKIIKHYYFREIGFETAGLFKWHLNQKLAEIMPYYNQLYKSELIKFNPLYNVDRTSRNDGIRNGNTSNVGNTKTTGSTDFNTTNTGKTNDISIGNESTLSNNKSKKVHSDTPQGMLQINLIENETYASDADYGKNESFDNKTNNATNTSLNENKQTGNNTNNASVDNIDNTTTNTTESYLAHVVGKEGSETYSEMLIKYRQTFLNIDMMIIEELSELFMNVY